MKWRGKALAFNVITSYSIHYTKLYEGLLDYYRGFYPDAQSSQPPQVQDDRLANELTVREQYQLPMGAEKVAESGLDLYADLLDGS